MSGWRIGYICFNRGCAALDNLREHLPKLARVRIATNLPVQYAAVESLRGSQGYIDEFVNDLRVRRDYVVKRLNAIDGLSCPIPGGAFYAFPKIENPSFGTDVEFVKGLLEQQGVLVVHGSGFGSKYGAGHFRLVYLPPITTLESAMNKIESFCASRQ